MRGLNNMKSSVVVVLALLVIFIMSLSADASILGGAITGGSAYDNSGGWSQLFPTIGNVGKDDHQSNNLFGFNEKQNITLAYDITPNLGSFIAMGTKISSHYIFFDSEIRRTVTGYVDFDADILGIITRRGQLNSTDDLGDLSAFYRNELNRGLERKDHVSIDPLDARRLSIDLLRASSPGDYIRVLTAVTTVTDIEVIEEIEEIEISTITPVPEPGTLILLGSGMTGLFIFRKIRRNK